jgi:general secretion pathway protein I
MSSPRTTARSSAHGFTLVEVLVALVVVVMGLAALLIAVTGTARTSSFLRDKTVAQWIALNRLTEVRLNTNKFGTNVDTGELDFANRKWHYDTRYFNTNINSMKRVVVRVYAGEAKAKGNPIAETVGFTSSLMLPGSSNQINWMAGAEIGVAAPTDPAAPANATPQTGSGSVIGTQPGTPAPTPVTPPVSNP